MDDPGRRAARHARRRGLVAEGLVVGSCAHSQGRGAVTRRPAFLGAVVGSLVLAGCAVGGAEVEQGSPEPRPDLARKAELAAGNLEATAPRSKAGRGRDRDGEVASGSRNGAPGTGGKYAGTADTAATAQQQSRSRPEISWTDLVTLDDQAGDHGDGPGYADLTAVTFGEADGMLAATVTVASTVPGALADREVEGVGIDLFRSSSDESDYQLFLDGGRRGWRAFLQTPNGFVDFPGTFAVRGRRLQVVVPWSSVGGREEAEASVFVDWSSGVGRLSTDGTTRVGLLADE